MLGCVVEVDNLHRSWEVVPCLVPYPFRSVSHDHNLICFLDASAESHAVELVSE